MRRPASPRLAAAMALGAALAHAAWAGLAAAAEDEAPAETTAAADGGGPQVFEPDFFAVYNPVTALDMVNRVPGFTLDDGMERRGFGATAGNVLINGERPSTKARVSYELTRIPASSVARLELRRGGTSDADVRGRTTMVNVVLVDGAGAKPTGTYEANLTANMGGRIGWFGRLARSFRFAGADVNLNVIFPSGMARSHSDELLIALPSGAVTEIRDEFYQDNYREVVLGGTAIWRPGTRNVVSLNARGSTWRYDGDELSEVEDPLGDFLRVDSSASQETDSHFFEVGGDWEHKLTERSSIKVVVLNIDVGWTWGQRFTSFTPAGGLATFVIDSPGGRGERIARGTWTWKRNEAHTFELGLEGAFNFRDTDFSLTRDIGFGPEPVPVPLSVTRVEELRGEAFVTDVWTVSPRLTLEAGFNFEASRITQTGDAEQEREFTYPKPRLIATYGIDENDQLRLSLVRDVAQLNFGEFASSVSLSNDTLNRGNENLEPEQTWQARAEWERRLGERAVVTIGGFYDAVESVQDLIVIQDIDVDGDGVIEPDEFFTSPGNLGDGHRLGADIKATLPLDDLGLSNALLKFDGVIRRTRVDDPLTGQTRSFTDEVDWSYTVDFRQDLPARRLAWGWDYTDEGDRQYFRADELVAWDKGGGDLDVFIETSRFAGVTLRLGVDNVFDAVDQNRRYFFEDTRASGVVDALEHRRRRLGQFYNVRISGSF